MIELAPEKQETIPPDEIANTLYPFHWVYKTHRDPDILHSYLISLEALRNMAQEHKPSYVNAEIESVPGETTTAELSELTRLAKASTAIPEILVGMLSCVAIGYAVALISLTPLLGLGSMLLYVASSCGFLALWAGRRKRAARHAAVQNLLRIRGAGEMINWTQ